MLVLKATWQEGVGDEWGSLWGLPHQPCLSWTGHSPWFPGIPLNQLTPVEFTSAPYQRTPVKKPSQVQGTPSALTPTCSEGTGLGFPCSWCPHDPRVHLMQRCRGQSLG